MTTSEAKRVAVEGAASASRQIIEEVTSWPGVEAGPGRRGELAFRIGRREIGHLHGDRAAHFSFPKDVWARLRAERRITEHPVFPGREGPAARAIATEDDVRDVIALLRLNYERATARGIRGLVAGEPHPLPFAPALEVRAFVLRRARGDVLLYSAPQPPPAGGVARWYLNHHHEAMFPPAEPPAAPLFVHEADAPHVRGVRATFSRRHTLDDDLEVVPTPGHTGGATAYLWDSGEHRVLFTGDTIYLDDGQWVAAVLKSSDRAAYVESLELIKTLDFDVLVPWATTRGQPYLAHTNREDAARRIDWIIERVRDGGAS
ncbi:MAG TPA: luciferase family protein [Solirubrobacteraceae bacterium]|nr:luciferase family protein [Solirubrobacteraceae bacterium]